MGGITQATTVSESGVPSGRKGSCLPARPKCSPTTVTEYASPSPTLYPAALRRVSVIPLLLMLEREGCLMRTRVDPRRPLTEIEGSNGIKCSLPSISMVTDCWLRRWIIAALPLAENSRVRSTHRFVTCSPLRTPGFSAEPNAASCPPKPSTIFLMAALINLGVVWPGGMLPLSPFSMLSRITTLPCSRSSEDNMCGPAVRLVELEEANWSRSELVLIPQSFARTLPALVVIVGVGRCASVVGGGEAGGDGRRRMSSRFSGRSTTLLSQSSV